MMAVHSEDQGDHVELTILMPCLNEAETLEICIKKALEEWHQIDEVITIV